jgi:hypothetical protein
VQEAEGLANYQALVHRHASLQQLMFYQHELAGCFLGTLQERGLRAPALLAALPGALRVGGRAGRAGRGGALGAFLREALLAWQPVPSAPGARCWPGRGAAARSARPTRALLPLP